MTKLWSKAIIMAVDKRVDNWPVVLTVLGKLGIPANLFIMGDGQSPVKYNYIDNPDKPQEWNYREAVKQVFREALSQGIERLCVFEDDIISYDNSASQLKLLEEELMRYDPEFDMVYMATDRTNVKCQEITPNLFRVGPCYHFAATITGRKPMEMALTIDDDTTLDGLFYRHIIHAVRAYSPYPNIFGQDVQMKSVKNGKYPIGVDSFVFSKGIPHVFP